MLEVRSVNMGLKGIHLSDKPHEDKVNLTFNDGDQYVILGMPVKELKIAYESIRNFCEENEIIPQDEVDYITKINRETISLQKLLNGGKKE